MIAGDSGFICSECVVACSALLQPTASKPPRKNVPIDMRFSGSPGTLPRAPLGPQELLATSRSYALRQQADLQAALDELFGERIVPKSSLALG
jgi:hypothetical protein